MTENKERMAKIENDVCQHLMDMQVNLEFQNMCMSYVDREKQLAADERDILESHYNASCVRAAIASKMSNRQR